MKKYFSILFVLFLFVSANAQDFDEIDAIVKNYPKSFSKVEKLAELINSDFQNPLDKTRAIYTWIASNIGYDIEKFYSGSKSYSFSYSSEAEKIAKEKEIKDNLVKTTLKKRKGVCQDYSTLFKELCDLSDIECVIISGSSKTNLNDIGKEPTISDHAWNAVKLDGQWHLIDATWGAGNVDFGARKFNREFSDAYFLTPPERFFINHFPEDREWLLVDKTARDFANQPLYYGAFIKLNMEMFSPKSGVISKAKDGVIKFKMKTSISPDEIYYAYQRQKYAEKIKYTVVGEYIEFSIPISNKRKDYLSLFYKNEGLITYKIDL